jgi:hypothetical protein
MCRHLLEQATISEVCDKQLTVFYRWQARPAFLNVPVDIPYELTIIHVESLQERNRVQTKLNT